MLHHHRHKFLRKTWYKWKHDRGHLALSLAAACQRLTAEIHHEKQLHRISFNGMRPLALNKKQVIAALGSSKLVARMLWASRYAADPWLVLVRQGRDLLIDTASVESAYERLLNGE